MKRFTGFLLFAVALALVLMPPKAGASSICASIAGNQVRNCGFDGGATTPDGNVPIDWNASQFTGFELIVSGPVNGSDSNSLRIANDEFQPGEPLLNGAAIMWQGFTDTPGEEYTFNFYVNNGAPGGGNEQFQAFWEPTTDLTDQVGNLETETPVYSDNGSGTTNSFTLESFTVTGTGADSIIFTAYNSPSYYYLADVSLVDTGVNISATPEPCTLMLLGSGFLGLGWCKRRDTSFQAR